MPRPARTTYALRVWATREDMERGAAPVEHLTGFPRLEGAMLEAALCLAGRSPVGRNGEAAEVAEEHPHRSPLRTWRLGRLP